MVGIARSSVVCFVIDTTGSMSDDIDEARAVVYEIIDSKKGTQDEPSEYILVPFNDPSKNSSIQLFRTALVFFDPWLCDIAIYCFLYCFIFNSD